MPVTLPKEQQKLQQFVDRRHPAFYATLPHWRFCEETFNGGRKWFAENIHEYLKEGTREYADRLSRSYRFNHTKEVVKLITKYIFKEGVIRNTDNASPPVQSFWQCATLDGEPIDSLMKQVSDQSSTQGRVYVVVDSQKTQGQVLTIADEKAGKTRTYAYLVKISDMLDFAHDDMGQFLWVLYKVKHRDDQDPIKSSGEVRNRFILWTREECITLEEVLKTAHTEATASVAIVTPDTNTGAVMAMAVNSILTQAQAEAVSAMKTEMVRVIKVIEREKNNLGEIPIVAIDHVENSKKYDPPGLVDDIAYLDKATANYLSNLDAIIQDQTFSQLVMPAQGTLPGEEAYDKMVEMGTKRVFLYDGESGVAPIYISPDANNANLILNVIKTIIGEIYHSVGMAGERTKQDNAAGIDNSSGVAKAYDFDRMNALLVAKAAQLDRAEQRIAYLVDRYAGKITKPTAIIAPQDDVEKLIKYPDDYDVRGLPDEFDIAQSLQLMQAPDSVRRQQMQTIITKLFPRLAKDLIAQMQTELKDWPVDPMDQLEDKLAITSKYSTGMNTGSVTATNQPAPGGASGGAPSAGAKPTPASKTPGGKPSKNNKQGQNNKD